MDKGAHFYRCDFQVHTPRDRQWTGGEFVTDEERRQYAASLVKACRGKGLNAVGVTDHHDLLFAKYVRKAAQAELDKDGKPVPPEAQLVVFPGIELTLAVPCQAILLFDADFPDDLFSLALTALAVNPSKGTEAKTIETKRLDHITTLVQLRDELDKHEYLKNRYIILPNVSEGGADTLFRQGNAPKYAKMPSAGGYLDGSIDQWGKGNHTIASGKAAEWGHKRIAVFQTSDNRRADHADLGNHSTWVKWAVPTAEALRQACLAQESRISQTKPALPGVTITGISVSNSAFLGPIDLEFNSQYNTLIGGRGTGKSTILEYLRWALCDQQPDPSAGDEMPNYQLRRRNLIEQTLQTYKATIQVSFVVNGIPHVVRRFSANQEIHLKVGNGEFTPCKESDVRSLLPIQAYSQKQLSNVSVRLEELSRFVEAPIRSDLDDIERQFERVAAETRQVYASVVRKRALQAQLANDELQLTSLTDQATKIRESLTGLSPAEAKLLSEKPNWDRAETILQTWAGDIERVSDSISEISTLLSTVPTKVDAKIADLPEADKLAAIQIELTRFVAEIKTATKHLEKSRDSVIAKDGTYRGDLGKHWQAWNDALKAFGEKYELAKKHATAHEAQLNRLSQIEKRIGELRGEIARAKKEIAALGEPEKRQQELRKVWWELHTRRAEKVKQECEKLTGRAQDEIRASIQTGGSTGLLIEKLRSALAGSGLRKDKLEALGIAVEQTADPVKVWCNILDELETLAEYEPTDEGGKPLPNCPTLEASGLGPADRTKIAAKLSTDAWLDLSLTRLEDRPIFEYRAREGEYIPFANASAGQQATSLLKALLNQPGPPLIIDQPEEDLDNPVILEVVEQVWRAKRDRQIIFSSHNANLVVNGDAELVVWCDYRTAGDHSGGQVRGAGAIDVPEICGAIKQVMEGGEAAFKLRRDKYGF